MSLAALVVTAVTLEGRTKAEVARDYGVSRQWVHELCRRFETDGEAGLEPRSRRPRLSPGRTSSVLEDEIVELRKELIELKRLRDVSENALATLARSTPTRAAC